MQAFCSKIQEVKFKDQFDFAFSCVDNVEARLFMTQSFEFVVDFGTSQLSSTIRFYSPQFAPFDSELYSEERQICDNSVLSEILNEAKVDFNEAFRKFNEVTPISLEDFIELSEKIRTSWEVNG